MLLSFCDLLLDSKERLSVLLIGVGVVSLELLIGLSAWMVVVGVASLEYCCVVVVLLTCVVARF